MRFIADETRRMSYLSICVNVEIAISERLRYCLKGHRKLFSGTFNFAEGLCINVIILGLKVTDIRNKKKILLIDIYNKPL